MNLNLRETFGVVQVGVGQVGTVERNAAFPAW